MRSDGIRTRPRPVVIGSIRVTPSALKTAVGIRCWQLTAKRKIHRRQNDRHILRGLPRFVAAQVSAPRVDVALTCRDDMRRAGRVVRLIKRDLTLHDVDEHRTRVGMPAGGTAHGVVVLSGPPCPDAIWP